MSDSSDDSSDEDKPVGDKFLVVELYAERVLDVSDQYGSYDSFSYSATNCLGKPSIFPSYGQSTVQIGLILDNTKVSFFYRRLAQNVHALDIWKILDQG